MIQNIYFALKGNIWKHHRSINLFHPFSSWFIQFYWDILLDAGLLWVENLSCDQETDAKFPCLEGPRVPSTCQCRSPDGCKIFIQHSTVIMAWCFETTHETWASTPKTREIPKLETNISVIFNPLQNLVFGVAYMERVAEVNFHFNHGNHNSMQSNLDTRHIATSNSQEHGLWGATHSPSKRKSAQVYGVYWMVYEYVYDT